MHDGITVQVAKYNRNNGSWCIEPRLLDDLELPSGDFKICPRGCCHFDTDIEEWVDRKGKVRLDADLTDLFTYLKQLRISEINKKNYLSEFEVCSCVDYDQLGKFGSGNTVFYNVEANPYGCLM